MVPAHLGPEVHHQQHPKLEMASECDPLLPRNLPSPEISGYGYPRAPKSERQVEITEYQDDETTSESKVSWIRTTLLLFTIVLTFGLFLSVLVPGGFDLSWGSNERSDKSIISERVEKILTDSPLIGHQ